MRTHTFLKIVAQTAKSKGLTDPVAAANFLSAILGQMTVDAPLKGQMLGLILAYSHINLSTVPETTLPTTGVNDYYYGGYGMGDVLFPVQPADNNVIKAWAGDVFPTPVAPTSVSVVSIAGSYDAAVAAGQALVDPRPQGDQRDLPERSRPTSPRPSSTTARAISLRPST